MCLPQIMERVTRSGDEHAFILCNTKQRENGLHSYEEDSPLQLSAPHLLRATRTAAWGCRVGDIPV